tara:strand:+ start:14021 stop:14605 length:585 start_codon:yes stop_codon:yes gene_type:complete
MADDATLAFYATNAADYVRDNPGQPDQPGPRLLAFLDALAPAACVLELGSGSGRDAAAMLARGFAVQATDASPELAAQAEQRLGRPVRILRFDELDAQASYDGVWANASLLHAPATELTDDLRRIHAALRPGGLFAASFKAGTGEGRDSFGRITTILSLTPFWPIIARPPTGQSCSSKPPWVPAMTGCPPNGSG